MKSIRMLAALALLLCCGTALSAASAASAVSAAPATAPKVADLKVLSWGEYVSGPRVAPEDLAGKVVIFENWGIRCGPCLANIPHMSELAALADAESLVVIANQTQDKGHPNKVSQTWSAYNGTDRVTLIDGGQIAKSGGGGIPNIHVFDHTGKKVFDGHPAELDKAVIQRLLNAAPGPLVKGGPYKLCAKEAALLKQADKPFASIMKTLTSKLGSGTDSAQAEAQALLDSITGYCDRQATLIASERTDNPVSAWRRIQRMVVLTRGTNISAGFESLLKNMRADKAFMSELKAVDAWTPIKAQALKLGLGNGVAQILKRPEVPIIGKSMDQLIAQYPNTLVAKEVAALRKSWWDFP